MKSYARMTNRLESLFLTFAFRKGITYGTIICNLLTGEPIDMLSARTTETFEAWLAQHPNVKLLTRDCATTYTKAINNVNSNIIQITNKWHFLKNLFEILKIVISTHYHKGLYEQTAIISSEENDIQ